MNIKEIVNKVKLETNNSEDIIYRIKNINKQKICIIYNEPLTSSTKISDFIVRSLTNISLNIKIKNNLLEIIENDISNFKVKKIYNYEDIISYLHKGFTIILADSEFALALETRASINRSIDTPSTENTIRGPKDSFIEDYQTNIGLIRKRIKSNDLWTQNVFLGKYTNTKIGVLSIKSIVKMELVEKVIEKLKKINIDGVINSSTIKNLIETKSKTLFPTIKTTERPDIVSNALLEGKVVIMVDNSPYALIIPGCFNDFFKTSEDFYAKGTNATFTRILKYICFFIALLAPAIYISLITYNQEMIPTELLISFAIQRDGVPFPAFFECFIMIIAFEILRESDLRVPSASGSSLSIVGALILGQAAVNAGIVSPIMIIVVALTAICSLIFTEPEMINALRWYRLLFMLGGAFLGIIGIVIVFIFFLIKMVSVDSFNTPYLVPYVPTFISGLKDSIIKLPVKYQTEREKYLSNNYIKQRNDTNEKN